MSFRSILLHTIAIILYLVGAFLFIMVIIFWFSPSNNVPTEYYAETIGYVVGVSLWTTLSAVLILFGWLIQRNLFRRKARLRKATEVLDLESY